MPILDSNTVECFSRSADQTRRFGMRLGSLLKPGDLVGLSGDLGAGKTTLISGVAKGWGSPDPVTSPTFVLVNEYYRYDNSVLFQTNAAKGSDADRMGRTDRSHPAQRTALDPYEVYFR